MDTTNTTKYERLYKYKERNVNFKPKFHLKLSADGLYYDDVIYIYGIFMLYSGQTNERKYYLDKLEWNNNKSRGDRCWRHIKRSL